jgi:hypothetical protein
MPTSNHTYLKLAIREYYTLRGKVKRPVLSGNRIDASWAVVASFKKLAAYYPWMNEAMNDISRHYGNSIFQPDGDANAQQMALDYLTKMAFDHQWVYVIPEGPDTVLLGAPNGVTFDNALFNELSGKVKQNPVNLSVPGPVKNVVLVDAYGDRKQPQPLEIVLHGHAFRGPAKMEAIAYQFAEWVFASGRVSVGRGTLAAHFPPRDQIDVGHWVDYLAASAALNPIIARPASEEYDRDPVGFSRVVVQHVAELVAAHPMAPAPAPTAPAPTPTPAPAPAPVPTPVAPTASTAPVSSSSPVAPTAPVPTHTIVSKPKPTIDDASLGAVSDGAMALDGVPRTRSAEHKMRAIRAFQDADAARINPVPENLIFYVRFGRWPRGAKTESLEEASFRELYQSTVSHGLYKSGGGLRKTASGSWIIDSSVPGRVTNSHFIFARNMSPPQLGPDGLHYLRFNVKSRPDRSTTGMRAVGFVKFLPPQGKGRPPVLMDRPVHVYCSCPDFKYRWHYVLADNDAAHTPSGIGGEAENIPPTETNPGHEIAICKHLCVMHEYLQRRKSEEPQMKRELQTKSDFLSGEKDARAGEKPKTTLSQLQTQGKVGYRPVTKLKPKGT